MIFSIYSYLAEAVVGSPGALAAVGVPQLEGVAEVAPLPQGHLLPPQETIPSLEGKYSKTAVPQISKIRKVEKCVTLVPSPTTSAIFELFF